MKKNVCEFNKIQKFESIREMMELAEEQAGDKIAFEYRDEKDKNNIIKVTYIIGKKDLKGKNQRKKWLNQRIYGKKRHFLSVQNPTSPPT